MKHRSLFNGNKNNTILSKPCNSKRRFSVLLNVDSLSFHSTTKTINQQSVTISDDF
jgi:hypothetical protein